MLWPHSNNVIWSESLNFQHWSFNCELGMVWAFWHWGKPEQSSVQVLRSVPWTGSHRQTVGWRYSCPMHIHWVLKIILNHPPCLEANCGLTPNIGVLYFIAAVPCNWFFSLGQISDDARIPFHSPILCLGIQNMSFQSNILSSRKMIYSVIFASIKSSI